MELDLVGRRQTLRSAALLLAFAAGSALASGERVLTFQERVKAQGAIERVLERHRIWPQENPAPKPPFEALMPRAALEAKVDDYLRKGAALDTIWHRPITAEQLQAEMDRMARQTQDPAMLQELFHALGDDPLLVAECLARPLLTERLIDTWYAGDDDIHAETRARAERALGLLAAGSFEAYRDGELERTVYLTDEEDARGPDRTAVDGAVRVPVSRDELDALAARLATSPRLEESDGAYRVVKLVRVGSGEIETEARVFRKEPFGAWWAKQRAAFERAAAVRGTFVLPTDVAAPGDTCDGWQVRPGLSPPGARNGHTAVWTGTEMIVWGGYPGPVDSGSRYTPATDSWLPTSTGSNCPTARSNHTAVWTGAEMIVWGGDLSLQSTGGRYTPGRDTWAATSTGAGCPGPRYLHTAVWTGTRMIVWGGLAGSPASTGGSYEPTTDTWTATSTGGSCPAPRYAHTAVWTGSEMIVWGGVGTTALDTGGRYDPGADLWAATSPVASPSPRYGHTAVWTGTEMVVWGGGNGPGSYRQDGGRYTPGTNRWVATSTGTACPAARYYHTAIFTGTEMIVWGGATTSGFVDTGGRYTPGTDTWVATSTGGGCPAPRATQTAVWTGTEMIVWGGNDGAYLGTGGRYAPASDTWVATSGSGVAPRISHTAVWTGAEMIVWGGEYSTYLNTGGRYMPVTDTWVPTSTGAGCPAPRYGHTALWSGAEMIVWGGARTGGYFDTGGRYAPATDTWLATSTSGGRPSARRFHTAVWTGNEMIVWGGDAGPGTNTGGRYTPVTDSWVTTSTGAGCPSERAGHTAVWTGSEMVVWGGDDFPFGSSLDTGGRYTPVTDAWVATSTAGCPTARDSHTVVWTGTEMIVWGGQDGGLSRSGGRYSPATDLWVATSTGSDCPTARRQHTAVWTGSEMIVWGGDNPVVATGGRYTPGTDIWVATSTGPGTPSARYGHTAVWTGAEMIVWGGRFAGTAPGDGGALAIGECSNFVVGAGLGPPSPNRVRVADRYGILTAVDFLAYQANAWGVNVAAGKLKLGTLDEILTGPGPGSTLGPHVRAFDATGAALPKVSYYAYGTLKYGSNVTCANLDADAHDEIGTGAGPGSVFGPHVRGWSFDNVAVQAIAKINYFAYGTLQWGVNVAYGDVDGDLLAEIVTAPGPGAPFAPQVRGWSFDGAPVVPIAKINFSAFGTPQYGANVAAGDVEGDGFWELAAAPGPGAGTAFPARLRGYDYDATSISLLPGYDVTPFPTTYGGRVGLGDVSADARAELLAGAGRDPVADATVRSYSYVGDVLAPYRSFLPLPTTYGVNVAAGVLGY